MKEKPTPCGEEEDCSQYTRPDPADTHYSDKPGHRERSLAHDPRPNGHIKHIKKGGKDGWR